MQNANPQSEQQATDLQRTSPIQSRSTQPIAINPNQLNPGLSIQVEGVSPQASVANSDSPAAGILWPVIVIIALVFVVFFVGVLFTLMKAGRADPLVASEEADITEPPKPKSKPKTKKKSNKPKRRR